jgi:hypothetical protein
LFAFKTARPEAVPFQTIMPAICLQQPREIHWRRSQTWKNSSLL